MLLPQGIILAPVRALKKLTEVGGGHYARRPLEMLAKSRTPAN